MGCIVARWPAKLNRSLPPQRNFTDRTPGKFMVMVLVIANKRSCSQVGPRLRRSMVDCGRSMMSSPFCPDRIELGVSSCGMSAVWLLFWPFFNSSQSVWARSTIVACGVKSSWRLSISKPSKLLLAKKSANSLLVEAVSWSDGVAVVAAASGVADESLFSWQAESDNVMVNASK